MVPITTDATGNVTVTTGTGATVAVGKATASPPDYTEGSVVTESMDLDGHQRVKLPATQRSAFGAVLTASDTVEIHAQFPYNINPRLVTSTTANGGTVTQSNGKAVLQTSAANNGSATMETVKAIKYTPGQGVVIRFTGLFTTCTASSTQEIGVGNATDGYFFGCNGNAFGINRRQNGSDNWTAQTAWNTDKMDGTGPSKQVLDITQGNVYAIEFQWLGFGMIRYSVENSTTGEVVIVNKIRYANTTTLPSIFNPTLPLHAAVINSGNASNLTVQTASMGAATEGPRNDFGINNAADNAKSAVSTITNIISLQNRATYAGITNRARIKLTSYSCSVSTGTPTFFRIHRNATLGGVPSFTNFSTNQSIAATDTAGTTVTGGDLIYSTVIVSNQWIDMEAKDIHIEPGETFTFSATSTAGGVNVAVSVTWREEF
jgi:hypothetical protein